MRSSGLESMALESVFLTKQCGHIIYHPNQFISFIIQTRMKESGGRLDIVHRNTVDECHEVNITPYVHLTVGNALTMGPDILSLGRDFSSPHRTWMGMKSIFSHYWPTNLFWLIPSSCSHFNTFIQILVFLWTGPFLFSLLVSVL